MRTCDVDVHGPTATGTTLHACLPIDPNLQSMEHNSSGTAVSVVMANATLPFLMAVALRQRNGRNADRQARLVAIRLGFSEGRNVATEYRWAGRQEHAAALRWKRDGHSITSSVRARKRCPNPPHHHSDCRLRRRNNRTEGCARISSWLSWRGTQTPSAEYSTILFRSVRTEMPSRCAAAVLFPRV